MELPRHVLGRAGTCHLFFSFQFLPLWTGLSTLGNNTFTVFHGGGGGGGGCPRMDHVHSLIATVGMSVLQDPSLALLRHAKPCRRWGFVGGLRSF